MSQAGPLDVIASHPEIPIVFDANTGSATPAGNTLNILGSGIITTTGSGNTITISATSGATESLTGNSGGAVSPTANNINTLGTGSITVVGNPGTSTLTTQLTGLTNHNVLVGAGTATITNVAPSTAGFVLTSNGASADPSFQTISASGAVVSLIPDAHTAPGTTPVLPNASGQITVTGSSTAAGTTPVRSDSLAANTITIEVQKSQAIASTDATKVGLAVFDSADFTVDANGFVSAAGTGFVKTLTGTTGGAIPPTANNINILAGTVVAGTVPLAVAGSGSTLTINAQRSQALAATDATKIGLSNFSSAGFGVDANGFVTQATSVAQLFTANTGSATPSSNNLNVLGGGGIQTSGSGSTLTIAVSGGGFTWSDKSTNFSAVAQNGYFVTGNATATLPASPTNGDTIEFYVDGSVTLTLQANTGQTIQFSTNTSSSAGTQANTASGDSCILVYRSTNTSWKALSYTGAWNKT